jgi:hypothetical protein
MDATNEEEKPRTKEPMRDKMNLLVLVHHGGTKSGRQVTFPQPGHLISVPDAMDVIRIATLHCGHGRSYSVDSRTRSVGPSTIDGMCVIVDGELVAHIVPRRPTQTECHKWGKYVTGEQNGRGAP